MNILIILTIPIIFGPLSLDGMDADQISPDQNLLTFVRHGFYESVTSRAANNRMIDYMETQFTEDFYQDHPILLAYKGVLYALKAKHVYNPYSKIKYLRLGLRTLDQAALEAADAFEVRFLRFSVFHHIPAFLRYEQMLQEEANVIFDLFALEGQYAALDPETALHIIDFLVASKRLNSLQISHLESLTGRLANDERLSLD